jgi:ornithine--oxo-acid transaminase
MTNKIYHAVYSSLRRAIVHTSTFSENSLSMRAGLATLDVLQGEQLGTRALALGESFRAKLRRELAGFDMVSEVRGMGLLSGIEFVPPKKLAFRTLYEAFHKIHPAMFGQILVMRMFREKRILTQICGNNFMVLKAAPPLMVTSEQLDEFVEGIRDVVEMAQTSLTFWTEALAMVRRAVSI